jgi:hypothetical protein
MHELEFTTSFEPPTGNVFGVVLDKYAIGHEMAMIRQGNPLATYSEASFAELDVDAKKLALAMAVEICGRVGFFSKFIFVIRLHKATDDELAVEISKFRDHLANGSRNFPLAKMPRQQGIPFRYFGAPAMASLLNYVTANHAMLIQSHFGGSPLNFPLGLAQMLYATHLETTGAVWVKNQQEMEREAPRKEGTPLPGQNEKVLVGEEAEKAFAEAVAKAEKGAK